MTRDSVYDDPFSGHPDDEKSQFGLVPALDSPYMGSYVRRELVADLDFGLNPPIRETRLQLGTSNSEERLLRGFFGKQSEKRSWSGGLRGLLSRELALSGMG